MEISLLLRCVWLRVAEDGLEVEEEFARCFSDGLGGLVESKPDLSERFEEQERPVFGPFRQLF